MSRAAVYISILLLIICFRRGMMILVTASSYASTLPFQTTNYKTIHGVIHNL